MAYVSMELPPKMKDDLLKAAAARMLPHFVAITTAMNTSLKHIEQVNGALASFMPQTRLEDRAMHQAYDRRRRARRRR